MTTFDDREKAFEAHFSFEQTQEFKAIARRDRRVGLWAGNLMGLVGPALEGYAASIVREDLKEPGEEDVFRKLFADLKASSVAVTEGNIRREMDRLLAVCREEVRAGE